MKRLCLVLIGLGIFSAPLAAVTLSIVAVTDEITREAKDIGRFMKIEGGLTDHSPEEIKVFQRVGMEAKVMTFFSPSGEPPTGGWDGMIVLPEGYNLAKIVDSGRFTKVRRQIGL